MPIDLNPHQYVVLTGAGFTKDFGGFLATEMHEKILNSSKIQPFARIRKLLLEDFDYESVYSKVMSENYEAEEKKALSDVMFDVYKAMDDRTKDYCWNRNESRGVSWPGASHILKVCTRVSNKKGYLFTTNQDIFVDRQCGHRSGFVPRIGGNQVGLGPRAQLKPEHYIQLPNEEEIERLKSQFPSSGDLQYIKLHGSLGWLSANGGNKMVLGKAKMQDIEAEPILNLYYHSIFKPVISQEGCHLLVVGYGFADDHINSVIVEAAKNHGLKLFVITPSGPAKLKETLEKVDPVLWQSIGGYFTGTVRSLFPYESEDLAQQSGISIFRAMGIIP